MNTSVSKSRTFKDGLSQLVQDYWASHREPLLLSRAGQLLQKRGYSLRAELAGRSLHDYIVLELSDLLEIVDDESPAKHLMAKPKVANTSAQVASIPDTKKISKRISYALLLAFSKQIPPGHVRRLQLAPIARFKDVPPDDPLANKEGYFTIDGKHLELTDDPKTPGSETAILQKIAVWMGEQRIDASEYLFNTRRPPGKTEPSLLHQIISALDAEDLSRISIPLDIVAKLLKGQ